MSLAGNSRRLTWVRHSSRKSRATRSYRCVQYFVCVQTMVRLRVFGIFNVYTDAHACNCTRGLYGHRKRIALDGDSGRKIPCRIWDSNPRQYCAWLLSRTLYQLSCFHPCSFSLMHGNDLPKTDDIELPFKDCTVDMPCIYISIWHVRPQCAHSANALLVESFCCW